MLKITVDTNVLISAILNPRGAPSEVIQLVRKKNIILVLSPDILDEVRRVLEYPKILKLFKKKEISENSALDFIDQLEKISIMTAGSMTVNEIERDPSDNMFLACAAEGDAEFIISGDRHLTDLKSFEHIDILTPSEFLERLS